MAFRPKKTPKKHPEWDMSKVVSEATLPKADGNYSELLKFPLYHGDMVLMHGSLIHRYYEVSHSCLHWAANTNTWYHSMP